MIERRKKSAAWSTVWVALHETYLETIIQTFRRVGMTLNPDGSEDAELQVKGLEDVMIGDWVRHGCDAITQEDETANVI